MIGLLVVGLIIDCRQKKCLHISESLFRFIYSLVNEVSVNRFLILSEHQPPSARLLSGGYFFLLTKDKTMKKTIAQRLYMSEQVKYLAQKT